MENPASWDDTQKLIDRAIYAVGPLTPSRSIIEALRESNLLKQEPDNLEQEISAVLQHHQEMLDARYCGSSASRQVYTKLQQLGVV